MTTILSCFVPLTSYLSTPATRCVCVCVYIVASFLWGPVVLVLCYILFHMLSNCQNVLHLYFCYSNFHFSSLVRSMTHTVPSAPNTCPWTCAWRPRQQRRVTHWWAQSLRHSSMAAPWGELMDVDSDGTRTITHKYKKIINILTYVNTITHSIIQIFTGYTNAVSHGLSCHWLPVFFHSHLTDGLKIWSSSCLVWHDQHAGVHSSITRDSASLSSHDTTSPYTSLYHSRWGGEGELVR